jgi:hypothetical protein
MKIRTEFHFTLPKGTGLQPNSGTKVTGTMRLTKVGDLVQIERDGTVQRNSGEFYIVLLAKVLTQLSTLKAINRKVIENLDPADFAFLTDFIDRINHQVIKHITLQCPSCGHTYNGVFAELGEA